MMSVASEKLFCSFRANGAKSHMLGHKLHSGSSKTKAGQDGLVRVPLLWKSQCATYVPAYVILYHARWVMKWRMLGQLAITIALPGFSDHNWMFWTPIFLLMNHFLCRFSAFSDHNEENLSIRSLNVLQNAPLNFVILSSWRVKFYENVDNIWNYLPHRPTSTKYN